MKRKGRKKAACLKERVRPKRKIIRANRSRLITAARAKRIAERFVSERMFKGTPVEELMPQRFSLYDPKARLNGKLAWLVFQNEFWRETGLRSSLAIAVCKRTGKVLYHGPMHDEG